MLATLEAYETCLPFFITNELNNYGLVYSSQLTLIDLYGTVIYSNVMIATKEINMSPFQGLDSSIAHKNLTFYDHFNSTPHFFLEPKLDRHPNYAFILKDGQVYPKREALGSLVLGVHGNRLVKVIKWDSPVWYFYERTINFFKGIDTSDSKVKELLKESRKFKISFCGQIRNLIGKIF